MKTFETEKNNIPEGATHYRDECEGWNFMWLKVSQEGRWERYDSGTGRFWGSDWINDNGLNGEIKPIPKPEVVEWNNGDECIFGGEKYTFGCVNPMCDQGSVVIFDETGEYFGCFIGELSKPESPEEKEQRERLEAAYDLYSSWVSNSYGEPLFCFKAFCDTLDLCTKWLAIVDKTNYRKGE